VARLIPQKISFSLTSYVLLAVVLVHLILIPVLYKTILYVYKNSSDEQFMLHARETSGLISEQVSAAKFKRDRGQIVSLMDSALLGGKIRYLSLVSSGGEVLLPTDAMMVTQNQFIEDEILSQHGDDIYFIKIPLSQLAANGQHYELQIGFDESAMNDEYAVIKKRLIIMILIYFATMMALISVVTFYIHKPLKILSAKSRKIASGDVTSRLNVNSNISDIKQLALDLERMRKSLLLMADSMQVQATHDELTGLPNRYLYRDRLDAAISTSQRSGKSFAVLLLDLDRFKEINDTLGHGFGDKVLQLLAQRMLNGIRASDTIARIGGDEFSVILVSVELVLAEAIAKKMIEMITPLIEIDGHSLKVGASVGLAIYPQDGHNAELLMQHADVAMYYAKHNNLDVASYHPDMDSDNYEKLMLVNDFKNSIAMNQFSALFQGKMDTATMRVSGCELLLRWQHPYLGLISPEIFIPLAEQENLIGELTRWATTRYLSKFRDVVRRFPDFQVSINVSPVNLLDMKLLESLRDVIKESHFPASNLIIEITENVIMKNPEQSAIVLGEFHNTGMGVSVDDFGTGYSSMAYLQRFPISELKIDKSFISTLSRDSNNYAIVKATIAMAHDLGIKVVAEGVECEAVKDLLLELKCDRLQGFYYHSPSTFEEFVGWLDQVNE
jgi:diguanylate cyclase (GGDEF)-like protein